MADVLKARSACAGLLPLSYGDVQLTEVALGPLTSLAPYKDKQKDLSEALQAAHGVSYPAPNQTDQNQDAQVLWCGRDMALLVGVSPDERLRGVAAVTDQSDAWAAVRLSGPGAVAVLARLVPIDLRLHVFPQGRTARTLLGHMNASITCTAPNSFLILVFRSMASTLVHELGEAMETVAHLSGPAKSERG